MSHHEDTAWDLGPDIQGDICNQYKIETNFISSFIDLLSENKVLNF